MLEAMYTWSQLKYEVENVPTLSASKVTSAVKDPDPSVSCDGIRFNLNREREYIFF